MNYDEYASTDANPPPAVCSVCERTKDDGDVDDSGKWVCFDCDAKEAK